MKLSDLHNYYHGLLSGALPPIAFAEATHNQESRAAYYQRAVFAHVGTVLDKNYSTLAEAVGPGLWRDLCAQYFHSHPAQDYEINEAVRDFPEFLEGKLIEGARGLEPWHVELAALEWAEFEVYASPNIIPTGDEITAPTLNPTLQVFSFAHPVASFLAGVRSGRINAAEPLSLTGSEPEAEIVFVFRDPHSQGHVFVKADDRLLLAFKLVHDAAGSGADQQDTTIDADLAGEVVAEAAAAGLIVVPENE